MDWGFSGASKPVGLVGDLDLGHGVGHAEGGIHLGLEGGDELRQFLNAVLDIDGVDDVHGLILDELPADLLCGGLVALHVGVAEDGPDILIGAALQRITVVPVGVELCVVIGPQDLVGQGLVEPDAVILHLDGFGHGVSLAVDDDLGDSVGLDHGPLDGMTAANQIFHALELTIDAVLDLLDGLAIDLGVDVLVTQDGIQLIDGCGDALVQHFEGAKSLVDSHDFSHNDSPLTFEF